MEDLNLDAYYTVDGYEGIAFYLLGYAKDDSPMECEGHCDDPELNPDGYGSTWYCDGSCRDWEQNPLDHDRVRAVMVGDDRVHIVDIDDLTEISDEDFCHGCGQVGCGQVPGTLVACGRNEGPSL